jgi:hypothetical protein
MISSIDSGMLIKPSLKSYAEYNCTGWTEELHRCLTYGYLVLVTPASGLQFIIGYMVVATTWQAGKGRIEC